MASSHAASVFTHSCLATPRDPVTKLPSDRLEYFKRVSESQEMTRNPHHIASSEVDAPRPSTTGGLRSTRRSKWTSTERGRDDSFQTSLGPDTPYIRPATVSSSRPHHSTVPPSSHRHLSSQLLSPTDPSSFVGNERHSTAPVLKRDENYATLFTTLLESNTLLREEIQKLREENHKTVATVEQLHQHQRQTQGAAVQPPMDSPMKDGLRAAPSEEVHVHGAQSQINPPDTYHNEPESLYSDSKEQLSQSLPPRLLENTWVESTVDQGESQQPSCMGSSQSHQSLPASAGDQHEYELLYNQENVEESSVTVEEVDPHQIHSESSSDSSRLSSPSAVQEVYAQSSHSTESLLSDSTTSSASNGRMKASRANEDNPFASPGMLAVERMWSDFSVEDYAPHSLGQEQEKRGKSQKKEWTPKITVPRPFSMTVRECSSPRQKSRSMAQAEQERLEREALEEAELRKQFHATPLPASTYLPLYELINAKNEQRREEVKMLSKQILKATERPFSFVKRDNERKLMRDEDMRRHQLMEKAKRKETRFHAKPVPRHVFDPDVNERLKEQEEYREIRIKLRAQELLASSKLPGSMQVKGREYSIGALRKKCLEENQDKAFMTDEHKFHPSVSDRMPDYDRGYYEFQKQLALRKKTKHTTATEPFYLRTELIPSRKEQVIQDIERDEELQLENRWPFTAPRAKVTSKSPKHTRSKSSNVPYPSQLTKTTKVRLSLTQEKLTSEMEQEQAKEKQQRERKERQEALRKSVTQKSLSYDPTAWLEEKKQNKHQQFR